MRDFNPAAWPQRRISRRQGMKLLVRAAAVAAFAPAVLAGAAAAPASQPATAAVLPNRIRDALARSAAAVSPITIRWTTRARSANQFDELARSLNAAARQRDRMINEHRHYRLTFQDGKYRASHQEEPADPLEPTSIHDGAFDGEFTYGGTIWPPTAERVESSYLKSPLAGQPREADEHRYLSSDVLDVMGIRLPVRIKEMKSKSPVRSEILAMLEEGAQLAGVEDVELDGRKLVRLRIYADDPERAMAEGGLLDDVRKEISAVKTEAEVDRVIEEAKRKRQRQPKRLFVFHLDPALNYAIVRREEFWEPDVPLVRMDLEGHEQLDDRHLFVPRKIVSQYYARKPVPAGQQPAPVQTRTTEVTHVSGEEKPPETFTIAYNQAGTRVYINDEKGRQRAYMVKEDGTLGDIPRR